MTTKHSTEAKNHANTKGNMKSIQKSFDSTSALLKKEIQEHGLTSETLKKTSQELTQNKFDYKKESEAHVLTTSSLVAMTASFNLEEKGHGDTKGQLATE